MSENIIENEEIKTEDTENFENDENQEENTETNDVIEVETITISYDEKLDLIHEDLGFRCCFLIIFVIVILLKYIYKFFDIFFKY